ncbi:MAG: DUF3334 family protein [Nitrospinota bacterium]|nr:DUF3334 family protein [Nitrospinota bacterium]
MDQAHAEGVHRSSSPEAANAIKMTKLFSESYIEAFNKLGGKGKFTVSPSYYLINSAQTRHRVASLLDFTGGINGLVIINYPEEAAIDVVSEFMKGMGMGPEDTPKVIAEEVTNTLGEICNQVVGSFRKNLERKYGFQATSGTPMTMLVNTQLNLSPVDARGFFFVRSQILTPSMKAFFIEFCIQEGVFVKLKA